MAINTPEELLTRVTECMNNKDLDTFVSLYEPNGSLLMNPERILTDMRKYEKK
jgi:hypothetical protein